MSEVYKYAAQKGLRFPSCRGELTVEQLFLLPLKSKSGFDLDSTAQTIYSELKSSEQESFVEEATASPRKKELEISLDIVKDVIKTKQDENKAQLAKTQKAIERKKILDALGAKKDQLLTQASVEDLEKQLAALED